MKVSDGCIVDLLPYRSLRLIASLLLMGGSTEDRKYEIACAGRVRTRVVIGRDAVHGEKQYRSSPELPVTVREAFRLCET
jgi:hypothetical protein